MNSIFSRPRCAAAGKVRGAVAGAVYVRARFYPHQWVTKFLWKFQFFQNRQDNSKSFCCKQMFIWIFVHLNKSSFNFVCLIFCSRHASRRRHFCGSWLQSVAPLLAETIHPIRLNARSQFWPRWYFDAMSPFWTKKTNKSIRCFFWVKKDFVIQNLIVTKKSKFCVQQYFVVKKKRFFGRRYQKA